MSWSLLEGETDMSTRFERQIEAADPIFKQINATVGTLNGALRHITPAGMSPWTVATALETSIRGLQQALKMLDDTYVEPVRGQPFKLTP